MPLSACLVSPSGRKEGRRTKERLLQRRQAVWDKLDQAIRVTQVRNRLILLGDYNTTLPTDGRHVGPGIVTKAGQAELTQTDWPTLQNIMHLHRLVALNTWSRPGTVNRTFTTRIEGGTGTQIDYAMMRLSQADEQARRTKPDSKCILLEPAGLQHIPLIGSLRIGTLTRHPCGTGRAPNAGEVQNAFIKHQGLREQVRQAVQRRMTQHTRADQINDIVLQAWKECKPEKDKQIIREEFPARQLWRMRNQLRETRGPDHLQPAQLLQRWLLIAKHRRLQKQLKEEARQRKKQQLQQCLAEAEAAAAKDSLSLVFKATRRSAPKTRKRRLRIQDAQGCLLNPEQIGEVFETFLRELYQTPEQPCTVASCGPLHIDAEEWQNALTRLQPSKAAAPHCAPSLLWTAAAGPISQCLSEATQHEEGQPTFPAPWLQAFLCFLPKPNKAPTSPGNLRPISLLEPASKALGSILAQRLKPFLLAFTHDLPQYAYLPLRSTANAITKVLSHCAEVRQLAKTQSVNVYQRQQGQVLQDAVGGIMLSVDLSRAFDVVPHDIIHKALIFAQVPDTLAGYIVAFHQQLEFHDAQRHVQATAGRGMRQGCPLAPALWTFVSGYTIHQIAATTGWQWIKDCLTLFADDILCGQVFHSESQLWAAIDKLNVLLHTLKDCKLEVNTTKSVVALELRGRLATKIRKKLACKLPAQTSEAKGIVIREELPWVDQFVYLGIVASYRNFESATLTYRKANILKARRQLSVKTRLRLWTAAVWTVLTSMG